MIVIVIVGILSAVALPNFLNQTEKAKLSEAKALSKAYLSDYHIATLEGTAAATNAQSDQPTGSCPLDTTNFEFDCSTAGSIVVTPLAASGLDTSQTMTSSVSSTGRITIGDLS